MNTLSHSQPKVPVWNRRVNLNFQIRGQGPALIYFHPAAGLGWDPFLEKLAESYTVYAPEFPGTTPGNPYAIHQVDDLADAVLIYEEAIRGMNLQERSRSVRVLAEWSHSKSLPHFPESSQN